MRKTLLMISLCFLSAYGYSAYTDGSSISPVISVGDINMNNHKVTNISSIVFRDGTHMETVGNALTNGDLYVSTNGVTSIIYSNPSSFQPAGTYLVPGDTNGLSTTNYVNNTVQGSTNGFTSIVYSNPSSFQPSGTYLVPSDTNKFATTNYVNNAVSEYVKTNGDGTYITNVNAALLGGYSIDDVMRVGTTYYFLTNQINYGLVTGSVASIDIPTISQTNTFVGPMVNGQYLGTYLIKSTEMPSLLQRGVYTFNFNGYHNGSASTHPTIGGDLYIYTTNGVVVQEFESTVATEVPRYTSANQKFSIIVAVTNDVIKDGYAFVLKTKVINIDGYTGNFTSFHGRDYWSGFTMPIVSGVYASQSDFDTLSTTVSNKLDINGSAGSLSGLTIQQQTNNLVTKEQTGWAGETDNNRTYLFDTNTLVFTITNATPMDIYMNGNLLTNALSLSFPPITTNKGIWYMKFAQPDGIMSSSRTLWDLSDAQVATVYCSGTSNGVFLISEETHGFMPWTVHRRLHMVSGEGSIYANGFPITMTSSNFNLGSGQWFDEDILHSEILNITNARVAYSTNGTDFIFTPIRDNYWITNSATSDLQYNRGGTQMVDVATSGGGAYMEMFLYMTPIVDNPLIWVVGRNTSTTVAGLTNNPPDISSFLPSAEAVLLYKVIMRGVNNNPTYTSITDFRGSKLTGSSPLPVKHDTLGNRDLPDQHPLNAITGYNTLITNGQNDVILSTITPANGTNYFIRPDGYTNFICFSPSNTMDIFASQSDGYRIALSIATNGFVAVRKGALASQNYSFYSDSIQAGSVYASGTLYTPSIKSTGADGIINPTESYIDFTVTRSNRVVRINTNGVGIGTSDPQARLDIVGSNNQVQLSIKSNSGGQSSNVFEIINPVGTPVFTVSSNGTLNSLNKLTIGATTDYIASGLIKGSGNAPYSFQYYSKRSDTNPVFMFQPFDSSSYMNGNSSGTQIYLKVMTTYAQTGTCGATDLLINRTETQVGSGEQLLVDAQVGGVSKFKVDNTGMIRATRYGSIGGTSVIYGTGAGNTTVTIQNENSSGTTLNSDLRTPVVMASGTCSATAGTFRAVSITPTYNQVGGITTNTDLYINRTETSISAGSQYLINALVNNVSKFRVDRDGRLIADTYVYTPTVYANTFVQASDYSKIYVGAITGMVFSVPSATPRMFISSNGFVGVNTMIPTEMLHVKGNVLINSNLNVSGTLVANNIALTAIVTPSTVINLPTNDITKTVINTWASGEGVMILTNTTFLTFSGFALSDAGSWAMSITGTNTINLDSSVIDGWGAIVWTNSLTIPNDLIFRKKSGSAIIGVR